jgi:hypothetical protein
MRMRRFGTSRGRVYRPPALPRPARQVRLFRRRTLLAARPSRPIGSGNRRSGSWRDSTNIDALWSARPRRIA